MKLFKKYFLGFFILLLLIASSFMIYNKLNPKKLPPNLIEGVGRIDGDLINLNSKYPGRIEKINIEDGKKIKNGEIIAKISSKEYEAKKRGILATIEAKKSELKAKEIELKITKEKLPENVKKAMEAIKAQKASLNELLKKIDSLNKIVEQDKKDFDRLKNLYSQNLIDKHSLEKSHLKLQIDQNRLKSLYDKKTQIISALNSSKSTLNQAKSTLKKIEALKYAIEGLKNFINALYAQKEEIEVILNELTIKSPIDGFVIEKIANKGEVIGAGMPIATLIDPKTLYLKIFVDTINNGKIKIGDSAVIFLDAFPDRPIKAKVVRIAQKAEFTPKEVAVRSDRIQRVYAVHLKPIKPNHLLKLGIPAIGVISLDGKGLPKSLGHL